MVDYLLVYQEVIQEIFQRIENIINEKPTLKNDKLYFSFNFGEGPELVVVSLEGKAFNYKSSFTTEPMRAYQPPEKIGHILCYASSGPAGAIQLTDEIKSNVIPGGAIIKDDLIIRMNQYTNQEEIIRLGSQLD